jgi:hypothetical protein
MKYKETIIKEADLTKLCEKSGIPSIRQLALRAGIAPEYLNRIKNGHLIMGERTWKKIKEVLNAR